MNGLFGLNGILGCLLVVVALLALVVFLGLKAVSIQQQEATNYYKLDTKNIQMFVNNQQFYQSHKE
ncbi:DUF4006 family protein [Helicobacter suis]|uniref:DUF4006 domain-containing protein n=1 Tax=Helicobacter suis TaxID=104628 RepID=A0A6J4CYK5_9HELI|nr:DUF4006 family protein [Helicobacter suis]BCD46259.1 hypothetical protein NHP190020_12980 [Helicobacter suis]BCD47827.1 hypothetical protein NHP194003_10310 [Helicobacter suis]BCD49586.1 hypothetical protein NHP194004_10330 [Helicobacter suis]BCD50935.1 hypothetical protein NHP194022_06060 [Helicobacter suis]BCD70598.1 hypothetical protein SNTW_12430 [Helicobacter suis]